MDRKRRILSLLAALAITLACVPALPTVAPLSTRPAGFVETMVAGTAAAAAKSTERASSPTPRPNDTLVPTLTPGPTLTPTATIIFLLPTIPTIDLSGAGAGGVGGGGEGGGSGGGSSGPPPEFACKVSSVTPQIGAHVKPDIDFKVTWRVSNRGSSSWDANNVDYKYILGAKIYKQPIYDLPFSVPTGNTIYLSVAMHSPAKAGVYSSTWAMNQSNTFFCKLEMKIVVP